MSSEQNNDDEYNFMNIHRDIGLKTIIIAMLFYIVSSPIIIYKLSKLLPPTIDILLIQTLLFAILYYIIQINLIDN